MSIARFMFFVLAGVMLASPLAAAGKGKGKGKGKPNLASHSRSGTQVDIAVVIGEHRRIVGEYLSHPPSGGLPPGLAKRGGALPPGLEEQLRKNGSLPPGLQKRVTSYPADLARLVPPLPAGHQAGFLEGRLVIFNRRTSIILDVSIP